MKIILIAAVDLKMGIGLNGIMPWGHIKEDMLFFKDTTINNTIVMGRVTFESLNCKALPNRKNIVISNSSLDNYNDIIVFNSLDSALESLKNEEKVFIIGGASIYEKAIKYADTIYLTHINKDYNCDRFFPNIDLNICKKVKIKDFIFDNIKAEIMEYTKL